MGWREFKSKAKPFLIKKEKEAGEWLRKRTNPTKGELRERIKRENLMLQLETARGRRRKVAQDNAPEFFKQSMGYTGEVPRHNPYDYDYMGFGSQPKRKVVHRKKRVVHRKQPRRQERVIILR